MARTFTASSSVYFDTDEAIPDKSQPLSMAAWFYPTATENGCVMSFFDHLRTDNHYHNFAIWQSSGGGAGAILMRYDNVQTYAGPTANSYTNNAWNHVVVTTNSAANSHKVYLNGGTPATNTDSAALAYLDRVFVGRRGGYDWYTYFNGRIALPAIWGIELSASDVSQLYTDKYAPNLVQSSSLIAYWKFDQPSGNETDEIGSYVLTAYNSPGSASDPDGIVHTLGGGSTFVPREHSSWTVF